MEFTKFEKSGDLSSFIVHLHDNHILSRVITEGSPRVKNNLIKAISNLFDGAIETREKRILADVMVRLIEQAETDIRQALAEKLAPIESVPLALVLHLANDEIKVASPILKKSPVLSDQDLVYIIKSHGSEYWQAIAARGEMSDTILNLLVDTRDDKTAVVLSENDRVALTPHALRIVADMAKNDEAIAKPLLMRPDFPPSLAKALYAHVGKELKDYIDVFIAESSNEAIDDAVAEVLVEFAEAAKVSPYLPDEQLCKKAEVYQRSGMLNMNTIMKALDTGNIPEFIAMFSRYTGFSSDAVFDFIRQACPKGLAIACRAHSVQKSDFSRIYLLTHKLRASGRIVDHHKMIEILEYFDHVRPERAIRIVKRSVRNNKITQY